MTPKWLTQFKKELPKPLTPPYMRIIQTILDVQTKQIAADIKTSNNRVSHVLRGTRKSERVRVRVNDYLLTRLMQGDGI